MMKLTFSDLKKYLRRLWPRFDRHLDGAKQKTPFNINRFVILIVTIIYTALSACIYFNWNAFRDLLMNAGKYKELNTVDAIDKVDLPQYQKITTLFPITLAIHFTTSVFCGFLYDHIGPKFTAILGQLFNIMSWIFFSIDTTKFDATLIACVFMGLGADTAFIPVLTIANLFPDGSTFILTLFGAAASISFAVPNVLNFLMTHITNVSFIYMCYGYIFFVLVPCVITALLLFPLKPFKGVDDFEREQKKKVNNMTNATDDNTNDVNSKQEGSEKNDIKHNTTLSKVDIGINDLEMNKHKVENPGIIHKKDSNYNIPFKLKRELSAGIKDSSEENAMDHEKKNKFSILELENIDENTSGKNFHLTSIKIFFKLLITFPSVCVILYFIIFNISIVFYTMVVESYFDYDELIINQINILLPLSCIPCILFGRLVNVFGATTIIIVMNGLSALMHITALIKYRVFGMCSAICCMCVNSMYTSQIYCFIQNTFPTVVFGKFVGFGSLCGGVFALCSELLYKYIIAESKGKKIDPSNVTYAIILAFLLFFLPLTILKVRKYERIPEMYGYDWEKKHDNHSQLKEHDFSVI